MVTTEAIYRDGEVCCYCGQIRSYDNLQSRFTPDTHFTAESMEWFCKDGHECGQNQTGMDLTSDATTRHDGGTAA